MRLLVVICAGIIAQLGGVWGAAEAEPYHVPLYVNTEASACTKPEQKRMVNLLNKVRTRGDFICDGALSWIAWRHAMDQNEYYNQNAHKNGYHIYTKDCNKHSWAEQHLPKDHRCCFDGTSKKTMLHDGPCMWKALKRLTGRDYGFKKVYEVSYGPDEINRLYKDTTTIKEAIAAWKTSTKGHNSVIKATGIWADLKYAGCASVGRYANCYFAK